MILRKSHLLQVRRDQETGWLVASWDDPAGGAITTQAEDLRDLQQEINDAVAAHFDPIEGAIPSWSMERA